MACDCPECAQLKERMLLILQSLDEVNARLQRAEHLSHSLLAKLNMHERQRALLLDQIIQIEYGQLLLTVSREHDN